MPGMTLAEAMLPVIPEFAEANSLYVIPEFA